MCAQSGNRSCDGYFLQEQTQISQITKTSKSAWGMRQAKAKDHDLLCLICAICVDLWRFLTASANQANV
ncbi:hypothetical protein C84B14_03031 [Salinisphaera sp. C84B14]